MKYVKITINYFLLQGHFLCQLIIWKQSELAEFFFYFYLSLVEYMFEP